jgi:L-asparaginase
VAAHLAQHSAALGLHLVASSAVAVKDSRALTDRDREALVAAVAASAVPRLLVPHGTFTLAETGRFLQRSGGMAGRAVALVGALVPLGDPGSDAPGNLAVAAAWLVGGGEGVVVVLGGAARDPATVDKDSATGQLVARQKPHL